MVVVAAPYRAGACSRSPLTSPMRRVSLMISLLAGAGFGEHRLDRPMPGARRADSGAIRETRAGGYHEGRTVTYERLGLRPGRG